MVGKSGATLRTVVGVEFGNRESVEPGVDEEHGECAEGGVERQTILGVFA